VAQLQHPHIAQVYVAETIENRPYFVMEYVDGGALSGRIDGEPWPPRDAAKLIAKLAEAIEFSHQQGIIHRDLKPANVLLTQSGEPKIADFGLAKFLDADSSSTKTGDILGTPSYMAPEQAGGVVKNIGPGCDVYALGAIFYELLTGRPPFRTLDPCVPVAVRPACGFTCSTEGTRQTRFPRRGGGEQHHPAVGGVDRRRMETDPGDAHSR